MPRKPTWEEVAKKLPGYVPPSDRMSCMHCGKTLPLAFVHRSDNRLYVVNVNVEKAVEVRYGVEGDGCFCTKGCGYTFGVKVARSRRYP